MKKSAIRYEDFTYDRPDVSVVEMICHQVLHAGTGQEYIGGKPQRLNVYRTGTRETLGSAAGRILDLMPFSCDPGAGGFPPMHALLSRDTGYEVVAVANPGIDAYGSQRHSETHMTRQQHEMLARRGRFELIGRAVAHAALTAIELCGHTQEAPIIVRSCSMSVGMVPGVLLCLADRGITPAGVILEDGANFTDKSAWRHVVDFLGQNSTAQQYMDVNPLSIRNKAERPGVWMRRNFGTRHARSANSAYIRGLAGGMFVPEVVDSGLLDILRDTRVVMTHAERSRVSSGLGNAAVAAMLRGAAVPLRYVEYPEHDHGYTATITAIERSVEYLDTAA